MESNNLVCSFVFMQARFIDPFYRACKDLLLFCLILFALLVNGSAGRVCN